MTKPKRPKNLKNPKKRPTPDEKLDELFEPFRQAALQNRGVSLQEFMAGAGKKLKK